jgi:hypothetical protein
VKKKQRFFVKRFVALVAALVLCSALCMPCFASNNASSQKWVVTGEANLKTQSGVIGRYLQLTPYVGGEVYATNFSSLFVARDSTVDGNSVHYECVIPFDYPDWWRSALPLGANTYIAIDNVRLVRGSQGGGLTSESNYTPSAFIFYPLNDEYAFDLSLPLPYGSDKVLTSKFAGYFIRSTYNSDSYQNVAANGIYVAGGSSSSTTLLQDCSQIVATTGFNFSELYGSNGLSLLPIKTLYNLSSDHLVLAVAPQSFTGSTAFLEVTAEISFFVDANKLPSGLQVGDEFPANTDAFDQLRDDLIEQFPEASENIQNGKSTLTGWNDSESVDTDVASSAMSALNAMFQNLGSFLFIISLMVFGAVVLRMFIKKAVDG